MEANASVWARNATAETSTEVTSLALRVSAGLLMVTLIVMSIVGNALVCVAIATEHQLRKLSNLFLVSLAIADLLVAALVMPFAVVNDLAASWGLGSTFCKAWIASDVMCSTASIVNLCAISLDRYIHIKDPLQYTEWITHTTVPVSIAVIWITSALISFLPISLDLHSPKNGNGTEAAAAVEMEDRCALDFTPEYSILSSIVSFFLPCVVMLLIYFHVYSFARYHLEIIKEQSKPLIRLRRLSSLDKQHHRDQRDQRATTVVLDDDDAAGAHAHTHAHVTEEHERLVDGKLVPTNAVQNGPPVAVRKKRKPRKISSLLPSDSPLIQEHKAAITIGIIMGVFLLCWTPFFVVNVVASICKDCISQNVFKTLTWLGYSNSAFNPVIYSIFNAEFRQAFHRILTNKPRWCLRQSETFV